MLEKLEFLIRERNDSPNFRKRWTYVSDKLPPVRAYIHEGGLVDAFTSSQEETEVKTYLIDSLFKNSELLKNGIYLLAAIWGENGAKMIDLFKYSDIKSWPGNPTVGAFVIKNGLYIPEKRDITCGDTLVVLGSEERCRRKTRSLNEYIEESPKIEGLTNRRIN